MLSIEPAQCKNSCTDERGGKPREVKLQLCSESELGGAEEQGRVPCCAPVSGGSPEICPT